MDFQDKKVLITGGTSGLGRELALQLARAGARVGVIARDPAKLARLGAEERRIVLFRGDVADKEAIHPLAAAAHARLGAPDILLNVASYLGATPLRLLVDTDCEDLERALQTNLVGPFRLTKALLPAMLLRKKGFVVNISSDAAVTPYPRWGGYAVSKAGLDHLTRIFDEELKGEGVRFLAIDPGDLRTPMHFAAIPDADPEKLRDPAAAARDLLALLAREDFGQVRRSL